MVGWVLDPRRSYTAGLIFMNLLSYATNYTRRYKFIIVLFMCVGFGGCVSLDFRPQRNIREDVQSFSLFHFFRGTWFFTQIPEVAKRGLLP